MIICGINLVRKYFLTLFFLLLFFEGFGQTAARQEKNIKAFAELFGQVRFFHPSDEAQKVYWNIFALYGAHRVLNQKNDEALITELKNLFSPFAPTVVVSGVMPKKSEILNSLRPQNKSNYKTIATWNKGIALPYGSSMYESKRINRDTIEKNYLEFLIDTKSVRFKKGANFMFSIDLRGDTASCLDTGVILAFGTSGNKDLQHANYLALGNTVKKYSFSGKFPQDVDTAGFIIRIAKTRSIKSFANPQLVVSTGKLTTDTVKFIRQATFGKVNANHFNIYIEIGEVIDIPEPEANYASIVTKKIGNGIYAGLPETLFGNSVSTFPQVDTTVFNQFISKILRYNNDKPKGYETAYKLSNSIVIWTALKYGFPYWEDANLRVDEVFKHLFNGAIRASSDSDYLKTLRLVSAKMNDGHMFVSYTGPEGGPKRTLPIVLEKIGTEIMVRHVIDTSYSLLKPGSIIKSIDGQLSKKRYDAIYGLTSGSPQWRNFKSLLGFFDGTADSVEMVVATNGINQKIKLKRSLSQQEHRSGALPGLIPKNGLIRDGIYYYNLTGDSIMKELNVSMNLLETAKSIIFDLRGYPKENISSILGHFLKCTEHTRWYHIPMVGSDGKLRRSISSGWDLSPTGPYLKGKIIFLTDGSTQSYPECILGYVKGLKLATIVGRPSSGANGDIQTIHLYNDFRLFYTGAKVTNLDGTKNHVIGVIPDIIVKPKKEGLLLGKDEILEKALEIASKVNIGEMK